MTPEEMLEVIDRWHDDIRKSAGDSEVAHSFEDSLWMATLRRIGESDSEWAPVARKALESIHIKFDRWRA